VSRIDRKNLEQFTVGEYMQRRRLNNKLYSAALIAAAIILIPTFCAIAQTKPAAKRTTVSSPRPAPAPKQDSAKQDSAKQDSAKQDSTIQDSPKEPSDDDRLPFMAHEESDRGASQPGSLGMLVRTVGALLLIIGILIGSMWCLRRIKGSTFGPSSEEAQLTVLKTISLGDRRALTVVRFGERMLLLGSTPQSLTLLASDEDETLMDTPAENFSARSVAEVLGSNEVLGSSEVPGLHAGYPENEKQPFALELEQQENWR
jgi:flagellar biosynthetic protein FliO